MADEPFLITPPPGLLPPPKEATPEPLPVSTGSETVRIPRAAPLPTPTLATTPATAPVPAAPLVPVVAAPPAEERRDSGSWSARLADGSRYEIGDAGLVLGRNPVAPAVHREARPVRIDDPGKSVSKTHALLLPEGDRLRVRDLKSTNGVAVTPPNGDATPVPADGLLATPGAIVTLGDYAVAIGRG